MSEGTPRTIRWGIVGCGEVAEVKSGPGFQKAAHSTLVAVMRRDAARAEDFARRHGVPRWHTDADAIFEAPDIDAVYIATLPDTHREYALRCAAAGKAVYVEKPMAMDAGECDAMVAACAAAGVPLWVGYYRRALPRFLAVRDRLREGAIGEVREVVSRQSQRAATPGSGVRAWRADPARSGGGAFFEGAVHTLDFLDFLFGPLEVVDAHAESRAGDARLEDRVDASYRFAGGVAGRGSWDFRRRRRPRIQRDHRYDGTHPLLDDARRADRTLARRRPRAPGDRRSAARAPAADPDYRRRDQWPRTLSEHRGVGGAHGARRRRRLAVVARAQPRRRRRDA